MLQVPTFHTEIDAVPEIKMICYLDMKYCHALEEFFQFPSTQNSLQYLFSYFLNKTLLPLLYITIQICIKYPSILKLNISESKTAPAPTLKKLKKKKPEGYFQFSSELS